MPKVLKNVRQQLLDKAQEILDEQGYDALTIRTLAAKCHVASGTVYNYFSSKDEIAAVLLLEGWQKRLDAIAAVSTDLAKLECAYRQIQEFAKEHEKLFSSESAKKMFASSWKNYHGMLRRSISSLLETDNLFLRDFLTEALLVWSMEGIEWSLLCELFKTLLEKEGHYEQL